MTWSAGGLGKDASAEESMISAADKGVRLLKMSTMKKRGMVS
jgi:hypothetical protein